MMPSSGRHDPDGSTAPETGAKACIFSRNRSPFAILTGFPATDDSIGKIAPRGVRLRRGTRKYGGWMANVFFVLVFFLGLGFAGADSSHREDDSAVPPPPPSMGVRRASESGGGDSSIGWLRVVPDRLSFGRRPMCFASVGVLEVRFEALEGVEGDLDVVEKEMVSLRSVGTSTRDFTVTNFESMDLRLGESVKVTIIVLPHEMGSLSDEVRLETSLGTLRIPVDAWGTESPYHVRPIDAGVLPKGSRFNPLVALYNPHNEPLEVLEAFSTEPYFNVARDTGAGEVDDSEWRVGSHTSAAICRLFFSAHRPGEYTGFLHVKTSKDDLVIPLHVRVAAGGVVPSIERVDFGSVVTNALWIDEVVRRDNVPSAPAVSWFPGQDEMWGNPPEHCHGDWDACGTAVPMGPTSADDMDDPYTAMRISPPLELEDPWELFSLRALGRPDGSGPLERGTPDAAALSTLGLRGDVTVGLTNLGKGTVRVTRVMSKGGITVLHAFDPSPIQPGSTLPDAVSLFFPEISTNPDGNTPTSRVELRKGSVMVLTNDSAAGPIVLPVAVQVLHGAVVFPSTQSVVAWPLPLASNRVESVAVRTCALTQQSRLRFSLAAGRDVAREPRLVVLGSRARQGHSRVTRARAALINGRPLREAQRILVGDEHYEHLIQRNSSSSPSFSSSSSDSTTTTTAAPSSGAVLGQTPSRPVSSSASDLLDDLGWLPHSPLAMMGCCVAESGGGRGAVVGRSSVKTKFGPRSDAIRPFLDAVSSGKVARRTSDGVPADDYVVFRAHPFRLTIRNAVALPLRLDAVISSDPRVVVLDAPEGQTASPGADWHSVVLGIPLRPAAPWRCHEQWTVDPMSNSLAWGVCADDDEFANIKRPPNTDVRAFSPSAWDDAWTPPPFVHAGERQRAWRRAARRMLSPLERWTAHAVLRPSHFTPALEAHSAAISTLMDTAESLARRVAAIETSLWRLHGAPDEVALWRRAEEDLLARGGPTAQILRSIQSAAADSSVVGPGEGTITATSPLEFLLFRNVQPLVPWLEPITKLPKQPDPVSCIYFSVGGL